MNAPPAIADSSYRALSLARIGAMVLRYVYLLRSSLSRFAEIVYWPMVQVLLWGFLQLYLNQNSGFFARAGGIFIGAVLLWDVLVRGQLGFSVSFLEEMWSRNMANILMSPLRPAEFLASLMVMSLVRLVIGIVPVTIVAAVYFGFNLWGLGFAVAAFFANLLLTSWAVGIVVSGLILRNGMGAENLAWTLMFVILPICAVYYPVATLPAFLQPVAWTLAPTYVFEGLRALLLDQTFRADLMLQALALNVLYMAAAGLAFVRLLNDARRQGSLLQTGE
ncbi:MAG: ABC transporter permease [Bauldia sp.]